VVLGGSPAYEQAGGDIGIGQAKPKEFQDLLLAPGERARAAWSGVPAHPKPTEQARRCVRVAGGHQRLEPLQRGAGLDHRHRRLRMGQHIGEIQPGPRLLERQPECVERGQRRLQMRDRVRCLFGGGHQTVTENMVENIAFGPGLAILVFGRPWFAARTASAAKAATAWLAAVWLFASWMPHAALHLHVGMQPRALLPIEWVFHAGAIVAIGALLWALSSRVGQAAHGDSAAAGDRNAATQGAVRLNDSSANRRS
jgi:hypothetical protein